MLLFKNKEKEIGISKKMNDLTIQVQSIDSQYLFKCNKDCSYYDDSDYNCTLKQNLRINDKKSFKAVRLCLRAKNLGNESFIFNDNTVKLIDSDGYQISGFRLCNELLSSSRCLREYDELKSMSQAEVYYVFPILNNGANPSKVIVEIDYHKAMTFTIGKINETEEMVVDLDAEPLEHGNYENVSQDYILNDLKGKLRKIKEKIYARTNNILTESEATKLENAINNGIYALKLELDDCGTDKAKSLSLELTQVETQYLIDIKALSEKQSNLNQSKIILENLYELSPREFEVYISDLLKELGYENVLLTPYSNDKGVDILADSEGNHIAVQCKRYKGTVGSPDIQTFIGAMTHAQADKGIFITTGMFSFEAERMAASHPIQLVNRITLAKWIQQAINKA